jgi:hypothetical protein
MEKINYDQEIERRNHPENFGSLKESICRVCGCTERHACVDENGIACTWVEVDLCSACIEEYELMS